MKHPPLRHSPIVEAVCEFRLAPDAAWDWTVPGILASELADEYPIRRQLAQNVIRFGSEPDGDSQPPFPPERVQLLSKDELSMIQSGPRMLAVNHLQPYPGWETFSAKIFRALDVHVAKFGWQPIQRVGLLYLNRIATDELPEQVLSVAPRTESLPPDIGLSRFVQQWELAFDQSGITLTTTRVADPNGYVVQLDAFTHATSWLGDPGAVAAWLEQAHETVYQVFEKSLTGAAFERLKG